MQHTIKVEQTPPLHFGLKSAGLGLVLSLVFITSCDFNGQKVPRYNTVEGERRLPPMNQEFVNPNMMRPPEPMSQNQPYANPQELSPYDQYHSDASESAYMQAEPQSYESAYQPEPMPAPMLTPPPTPALAADPIDPRPIGYRDEPQMTNAAPAPQRAAPMQQPAPAVQARNAAPQQDPFEGLPALPSPPGDYPHLSEVPNVPQRVQNFAQQEHDAMFQELEQARNTSHYAKQAYAGETEIPANYFQQQPMPVEPMRQAPQGNAAFIDQPVQMAAPMAQPAMPPANYMAKDEIVFETEPAYTAPVTPYNALPPLPAPPKPEYMRTAGYAAPTPAPAPYVAPTPAPVERAVPMQQAVPAPHEYEYSALREQPVAQQPLAPIQLRAPQAAAAPAPIQLRAPSNPYGTGETLRSSRYVSRYATRRLQTSGGVY